jgi:hypothetical protein
MPVQKLLAKIHIAQKQLGIEDSTYRDILYRKFRVTSSKSLSDSQALVLIGHFRRLGWQPRPSKQSAVSSRQKKYEDQKGDLYSASPAIKRKIEAMWHDYHHDHCRCSDETGHLRRWLFKSVRISDVAFLDKRAAYDAVEALKNMTRRRGEPENRPPAP